jgi:hypothetical protein
MVTSTKVVKSIYYWLCFRYGKPQSAKLFSSTTLLTSTVRMFWLHNSRQQLNSPHCFEQIRQYLAWWQPIPDVVPVSRIWRPFCRIVSTVY